MEIQDNKCHKKCHNFAFNSAKKKKNPPKVNVSNLWGERERDGGRVRGCKIKRHSLVYFSTD